MSYDLVVRDGFIVDGSGLAGFQGDIGVADGRIAKIGRIRERGNTEIDADGLVVSPGFIDAHTHMDAQVHWDPLGTCSCWHGVTSVVMGNCGFTLAPVRAAETDLVVRNLENAEDISADAMAAGIKWGWETFPEYLDCLDALPKGINYAANIGHSALRTWAMGEAAFERGANADELAMMREQLRQGLQAGAVGFTTSRTASHTTADQQPVASRLAPWDEVRDLVGVLGDLGSGVFEISLEGLEPGADRALKRRVLSDLADLALSTRVPTAFGVLPLGADPTAWQEMLQTIDEVVAGGGRMVGMSHPVGVSVLLSFETRTPFDKLPQWRALRERPLAEQAALLRQPDVRARLVKEASEGAFGEAVNTQSAAYRKPDWSTIRVLRNPIGPNPSVAALAQERGVDPIELFIDLALERDLKQFFQILTHSQGQDALLSIMSHPHAIMTFSDSGAHVSQIMDSALQTQFLSYWARERGDFSLEQAVRMITLAPARAWGLKDRGLLREGMAADINVFDYQNLTPTLPELRRDLPAGAQRLICKAQGIHATIVGGQVVLRDGEHTGALPGRLLRH